MRPKCRALLVALMFDLLVGEPPNAIHPVVVIGRWFRLGEQLAPVEARPRLLWGAVWLLMGIHLGRLIARRMPEHPVPQGIAVSTLLAYRALDHGVGEVQGALQRGDLAEARRLAGWHLVSRPTSDLTPAEVAAAAIESLAENLSDSVIAPMMWYLIGRLPGLMTYRVSNTADAMWGYRTPRYEYLGKAPARCDDLLNVVPARLTGLLIVVVAHLVTRRAGQAWRTAWRDHGRTASPNAGWPMAAMAGALHTTLAKRGHYVLGSGEREPNAALLAEARTIARGTLLLVMVALAVGACAPHACQAADAARTGNFSTGQARRS